MDATAPDEAAFHVYLEDFKFMLQCAGTNKVTKYVSEKLIVKCFIKELKPSDLAQRVTKCDFKYLDDAIHFASMKLTQLRSQYYEQQAYQKAEGTAASTSKSTKGSNRYKGTAAKSRYNTPSRDAKENSQIRGEMVTKSYSKSQESSHSNSRPYDDRSRSSFDRTTSNPHQSGHKGPYPNSNKYAASLKTDDQDRGSKDRYLTVSKPKTVRTARVTNDSDTDQSDSSHNDRHHKDHAPSSESEQEYSRHSSSDDRYVVRAIHYDFQEQPMTPSSIPSQDFLRIPTLVAKSSTNTPKQPLETIDQVSIFIDTGANINTITETYLSRLFKNGLQATTIKATSPLTINVAGGNRLQVSGDSIDLLLCFQVQPRNILSKERFISYRNASKISALASKPTVCRIE